MNRSFVFFFIFFFLFFRKFFKSEYHLSDKVDQYLILNNGDAIGLGVEKPYKE